MKQQTLVIIDGNALLHRAFHGVPPLQTKDGTLVNAVYGFTTIIMRVLKDVRPTHMVVTFDMKGPTFRHEAYEAYKATRVTQPDELYAQLPLIKQVVKAFGVPIVELKGYEADDVIGTIATQLAPKKSLPIYIVTGDHDTLQLVNAHTFVYTMKKSITDTVVYDESAVMKRYGGLKPKQLVDYKALRGDASDNIPGVRGVGEKTAIELLNRFGSLDQVYAQYESSELVTDRIKKLLTTGKEQAYLSQRLARIVVDAPIEFDFVQTELVAIHMDAIVEVFQKLEFKSLLSKLPELENTLGISSIKSSQKTVPQNDESVSKGIYELIDSEEKLGVFIKKLAQQKQFAIDTETTGLDPWDSDLVGISIAWEAGTAYYIDWRVVQPLQARATSTLQSSLFSPNEAKNQVRQTIAPTSASVAQLCSIFADQGVQKIGHNIKFDAEVLLAAGMPLNGLYYDTMIAAYLRNPGSRQLKLDALVFAEFGYEMIPIEALIGKKGKDQKNMGDLAATDVYEYAAEDVDMTWRLFERLQHELHTESVATVLADIEIPLLPVLIAMEQNGVKIDEEFLATFSKELSRDILSLQKTIYDHAGTEFNIASPKQLKEVLFDGLDIPTDGLKKTKTGISTAASELKKMKGLHPIIDLISEYRELTKLQSTYVTALPKLVNRHTGRVHTSYNQTIAATGRLSSTDPNLQNIPIRTELGRKIRNAFIAENDTVLLAVDYSQIELRVVAHLSDDADMIETFVAGGDIHTTTAAFIHDVPLSEVTSDMRRSAKEINFGVLYGMGAYGVAQRTGISRSQAREFIERYFERYPKMEVYTKNLITFAKEHGYVETLFGRRRYLPDIESGVQQVRAAAERAAINLPVQGTSADIMKLAMIAVHKQLQIEYPAAKMLMQVHDELVFEVPHYVLDAVVALVCTTMQQIVQLKVPLTVEAKVGSNWGQMEVYS